MWYDYCRKRYGDANSGKGGNGLSGKPVMLIGIAFSTKKRAVSGAKIIRDGQ